MKLSIFLSCLFFLLMSGALISQSAKIAEDFRIAEKDIVLVKNENQVIPLKDLENKRIALVGIGLKEGCDFQGTLQRYTKIKTIMPPAMSNPGMVANWVNEHSANHDLFIIGINDYEEQSGKPDYIKSKAYIQTLIENTKTITVVFGGDQAFRELPFLKQSGAVVVTPYNPYSHSLAAQLIFGGLGAFGKIDRDLGAAFNEGDGLITTGDTRLRYSPAEIVGMNAQLLEDSIRAIVEAGIKAGAFPGAQVLVAKDGHVVYHETFGYQTYDSLIKVTSKDIYDFASVTKVTGALPAVMKLHGEGKFDLDAPLKQYFPDFKKSNKADLSYRLMLAHQARLRPWIPYWRGALKKNAKYPWKKSWSNDILNDGNFRGKTFRPDSSEQYPIKVTNKLWLYKDYKKKTIYKAIKKSPLNEKEGYIYSGLLFYLLPEIISDLTGQGFETYLKQTFYHPLGAYTLTYNPYLHFPLSRIIPTERDTFFRMLQIHGWVHDEGAAMMGGVSSNAGLFGSANDLAKLMQMYLNGGIYGERRYISEATVREFARCQYCDKDNRRGLGFDKPLIEYDVDRSSVAKDASPDSFGHSGYTGTFTWVDPENNLLFIFFSNRVYPTRDNPKIYRLGIRPRIHQVLYDAAKGNGR